jgi:hypothetical protein
MTSSTDDNPPARYLVTATVWLEHERGPEPSKAEVAQAVADRLGDGAYHLSVDVPPNAEEGTSAFEGARMIPTATEAEKALRID